MSKLSANALHVWQIPLVGQDGQTGPDAISLSQDEIQRADRFRFEKDRTRYVAARSAMRSILARYLGITPSAVAFSYAPKGKPELAPPLRESGIQFNLSHSGDFALLAAIRDSQIGTDIEFMDPAHATGAIADRFFSPAEARTLQALADHEKVVAFFQCWTRKEAYIKALGAGLSLALDSFDVAFGPGVLPALLRAEGAAQEVSRWSMYNISAPPGYAAAIVVEGQGHQLHQQEWNTQAGDPPSCPLQPHLDKG